MDHLDWWHARADVLHDPGADSCTLAFDPFESADRPLDARRVFLRHFNAIHAAAAACPSLGVLFAAFDDRPEPIGMTWIAADPGTVRARVIGRHHCVHLGMPASHSEISLRHLLVTARPIALDEVQIRVLDLNTPLAFFDESGRALRSVVVEGSAFFRLGRVTLMALVTDPTSPLPDDARGAYDCIPERVFLSERIGSARRWFSGGRGSMNRDDGDDYRTTWVTAAPAPVCSQDDLLPAGDRVAGTVTLEHDHVTRTLRVGESALARGILIGRYARCDLCLDDSAISRTHLVLMREPQGGDVLAFDLASSLGTVKGAERFEVTPVRPGESCILAGVVRLSWQD